MTLTQRGPSMISCTPEQERDDMATANDRAERDGVRIHATCDPLPRFIAQVREDGAWVDVANARDLEDLRILVARSGHPRRDELMPLLNVGEVAFGAPTPDALRAWVETFTSRRRAAAVLGIKRGAMRYLLNGEREASWSWWCAMAAVKAARRHDAAVEAIDAVSVGASHAEAMAALVEVRRILTERE